MKDQASNKKLFVRMRRDIAFFIEGIMILIPQMASVFPDVIIISDDEDELSNIFSSSSPFLLQTSSVMNFLEISGSTDIQLNGSTVDLTMTTSNIIPNADSHETNSKSKIISYNSQRESERMDVIAIDDSEDSDCSSTSSDDSPSSSQCILQASSDFNFLETSGDTHILFNGSTVNLTMTRSRETPNSESHETNSILNVTSHNLQIDPERLDVIILDYSEDSDCSSRSSDDSPCSSGPWLNTQPSTIDLNFMETLCNPETIEKELTQTEERRVLGEPSTSQQPGGCAVIDTMASQKKRTKQQYPRAKTPEDFWLLEIPDSKTEEIGSAVNDCHAVHSHRRKKPLLKKFKSKTEEEAEKRLEEARRKQEEEIRQEEARKKQEEG